MLDSMTRPATSDEGQKLLDEIRDSVEEREHDRLAEFVYCAARVAAQHKRNSGAQTAMERARRAVRCEYDPEDMALLDANTIYMGVTNLKVRAFRSWVSDILLNAEDKPWVLRASPVPDLPEEVEDVIIDKFLAEVATTGFSGDITSRLSDMKRLAKGHMDKLTRESAAALETVIEDQLTEGGWREAFDEFINDLGALPGAVLKGPFVEYKSRLKWNGSMAVAKNMATYSVKRISPFDLYPSPDSVNPQQGTYLVERTRMDQHTLLAAGNIKGFRQNIINEIVLDNPYGYEWREESMVRSDDPEAGVSGVTGGLSVGGSSAGGLNAATSTGLGSEVGGVPGAVPEASTNFDVLIYYGKIKGDALMDWGLTEKDGVMSVLDAYETEVWVCGGQVIRALLNPNPTGKRPFYVASFASVPGQFWGQGLACLLRDIQRVCNATARSQIKNMALAAGPIGEYDVSRMASEEDVSEVQPYRLYAVDADQMMPTTAPAFRFHNINSNARELMEIYERYQRQADDVSGIPAYVLGNPQVSGAGRTLGGLSLLMGNAAKGIKKVINEIDKRAIEPLIEAYVEMNLMFNPNPAIKFDTQVVSRGSSGLLQKELSQSRAIDLLQLLVPMTQQGYVPMEGLQIVLRDAIRGLGYTADEIVPSPDRKGQLQDFISASSGGNSGTPVSSNPATAPPALDARSLPVQTG